MNDSRKIIKAAEDYQNYGYSNLRMNLFEQSLNTIGKGRLIDLGAGHCSFSIKASQLGWETTALDIREERKPDLPPEIRFINADVSSSSWKPEDYDVVAILGLFYHLDQKSQHELLSRLMGKILILDTHTASNRGTGYFELTNQLGPLTKMGGEIGRVFAEAPGNNTDIRKQDRLLASYENEQSWWATRKSLLKTLNSFGWSKISEKKHKLSGAKRIFLTAEV